MIAPDRIKEAQRELSSGASTINQIKDELGLDPIEDGDRYMCSLSEYLPISKDVELKMKYLERLEVLRRESSIQSGRKSFEDRIEKVLDSIEDDLGLSEPKPLNVGNLTVNITARTTKEFDEALERIKAAMADGGKILSEAMNNITLFVATEEGNLRGVVSSEESEIRA
ncbi:hypothetical protein EJP82_01340 [Paenibacillus anaericanus]|uniref:Uncharacterized protein n=1 Tax=Paenibacillus anaericanus TaxID=170367 RepID=A0A433YFJ5_9BACL|nr:hypothetical protein [Paenibacillus anaericanus]RUT48613.1 hypothetical protein EJP82_01340 [Paenibacillus anaericanus]